MTRKMVVGLANILATFEGGCSWVYKGYRIETTDSHAV